MPPPSPNKQAREIIRAVERTIADFDMLQRGDRVLIAVSGGPDSMALLHLLVELAPEFEARLAVAHVNHGLRPQAAEADQRFTEQQARRLGLNCHSGRADVAQYRREHALSLEEAARKVRYAFLRRTAQDRGYNKIALGHQADDNAETVLMFLMRGAGPTGLAGIAPVRENLFVRPLIRLRRAEIAAYNQVREVPWVADRSNANLSHTRNRLRHRLLPLILRDFNPRVVDTLNRLADVARNDETWMNSLLQPLWDRTAIRRAPQWIAFRLPEFNRLPLAARRRLIRKALYTLKGDLRRIGLRHVDALVQLAGRRGDARLCLPGAIRAQRDSSALRLGPEREAPCMDREPARAHYRYSVEPPAELIVPEAALRLEFSEMPPLDPTEVKGSEPHIEFFDLDTLDRPLVVRNYRTGDRFRPLGVDGHQRLKKFFSDRKVSPAERRKCPLLLDRDRILWVVGHRRSGEGLVGPHTRRVLKVELSLA
jgi:tRNA(Ile)-lysidine synthase